MSAISVSQLIELLQRISAVIIENEDYLTDLDRQIGDADHGLNMSRGFRAVKEKLPSLQEKDAGTILKTVGMTLVSVVGGASGPLYGTAFLYAGKTAEGKDTLETADAYPIARAFLDGVIKRGKANPGDKTMVDTLDPVVSYLASFIGGNDMHEASLREVVEKARLGMEFTEPIMALKGRASFLKERSMGHLDPGAVSSFLMIRVICEYLAEDKA